MGSRLARRAREAGGDPPTQSDPVAGRPHAHRRGAGRSHGLRLLPAAPARAADLLADYAKQQIDLAPTSGDGVERAIAAIYAAEAATLARVKPLVPGSHAVKEQR
jgi:hypothetical protein